MIGVRGEDVLCRRVAGHSSQGRPGGAQGHGSRVKRGEAWSRDTPTPHQPHCTAITVHNTQPRTFTHVTCRAPHTAGSGQREPPRLVLEVGDFAGSHAWRAEVPPLGTLNRVCWSTQGYYLELKGKEGSSRNIK